MEKSSLTNQEIIDRIASWIKTYAENAGVSSLVVGISGGIDSALVSTLCCKTGLDVHLVSMPIHQDLDQMKRANSHMEKLEQEFSSVKLHYASLSNAYDCMASMIPFSNDLSKANTKSRMRMVYLYYLAGNVGGLVVGTGNKVEDFGVGFFTKYGDGGVDLSPIAMLTKTQVRELAKEIGVMDEIIQAKPTDGLWEDKRTDEDQIGATYEELEWAMDYLERGEGEELNERELEVLKIYDSFHTKNFHKMIPIPVCNPFK